MDGLHGSHHLHVTFKFSERFFYWCYILYVVLGNKSTSFSLAW